MMSYFSTRLSWLLCALTVFFIIVSGIACYYAGYYAASKEFYAYYMAESLNDRIVASLYTLYGDMETDTNANSSEESTETDSSDSESSAEVESTVAPSDAEIISPEEAHNRSPESAYYDAYLIGFGAKRSAERYAERLVRDGIPARVITRENTNARNKKIMWYQVAVGPLAYDKLLEIVELLKYRDKLEGVVFVECKKIS